MLLLSEEVTENPDVRSPPPLPPRACSHAPCWLSICSRGAGMMAVAVTPNMKLAAVCSAYFYSLFNLFAGFTITQPNMPGWWYASICPTTVPCIHHHLWPHRYKCCLVLYAVVFYAVLQLDEFWASFEVHTLLACLSWLQLLSLASCSSNQFNWCPDLVTHSRHQS